MQWAKSTVEGVKGWALGCGFHRLVGVESCWVGFGEAGGPGYVSFLLGNIKVSKSIYLKYDTEVISKLEKVHT